MREGLAEEEQRSRRKKKKKKNERKKNICAPILFGSNKEVGARAMFIYTVPSYKRSSQLNVGLNIS